MPPRCPNGYRRNKKTGECVAKSAATKEPVPEPVVAEPVAPLVSSAKPKRCPKGTRKNKNGECVSSVKKAKTVKKTVKKTKAKVIGDNKIPFLSRQEELEANLMFRQLFAQKISADGFYKSYRKETVDDIEEHLRQPISLNDPISSATDDIDYFTMMISSDDYDELDNIFFDALEETQSKMEYYKNMQTQFPDLAKISLKIMGKRDYSNDSNKMPWSQHAIDILNNIATNNKKSAFDYSKLSK